MMLALGSGHLSISPACRLPTQNQNLMSSSEWKVRFGDLIAIGSPQVQWMMLLYRNTYIHSYIHIRNS